MERDRNPSSVDFIVSIGGDNLAWAKPEVDEARAAVARGEFVSLDEAVADIDAHLASLKR